MSIKQAIIFLLSITALTGCRQGYKVEGDKVYYESWNEGSGQHKYVLKEADAATFKELDIDCDCNMNFGGDRQHLFINGELMNGIDPASFQFIGNYIFRDKDSAYFFGFFNNLNDCVIKGVDPEKIKLVEFPWAKAGSILIHGKDTVTLEDINEFKVIDEDWGKTKKHVINGDIILVGADPETFKVISNFEGKDKHFNYVFGYVKSEDFKKAIFKTFDFSSTDFCTLGPVEFTDLYREHEAYIEETAWQIETVEKLKTIGFKMQESRKSTSGESIIITLHLTNNACDCYVEKFYKYDYSMPADSAKAFMVTERVYCVTE